MLGRKRKLKKLSKSEPSFLSKLYQILTEKEYSQYIHWSNDGLSVIISDLTLTISPFSILIKNGFFITFVL